MQIRQLLFSAARLRELRPRVPQQVLGESVPALRDEAVEQDLAGRMKESPFAATCSSKITAMIGLWGDAHKKKYPTKRMRDYGNMLSVTGWWDHVGTLTHPSLDHANVLVVLIARQPSTCPFIVGLAMGFLVTFTMSMPSGASLSCLRRDSEGGSFNPLPPPVTRIR